MLPGLTITNNHGIASSGDYDYTLTSTTTDTANGIAYSGYVDAQPQLSLSMLEQIKAELGFYKNPLQKCGHCGQYGAVFCECPKCGAPIDPKD